jgi:hypothetical protein
VAAPTPHADASVETQSKRKFGLAQNVTEVACVFHYAASPATQAFAASSCARGNTRASPGLHKEHDEYDEADASAEARARPASAGAFVSSGATVCFARSYGQRRRGLVSGLCVGL